MSKFKENLYFFGILYTAFFYLMMIGSFICYAYFFPNECFNLGVAETDMNERYLILLALIALTILIFYLITIVILFFQNYTIISDKKLNSMKQIIETRLELE